MVRLPDSPDDWTERVHTSGRHYLTNARTSETRWLWQKWDMNGRLFVRNVAEPSRHVWVDAMDLPMRLAAGMASAEEVAAYRLNPSSTAPAPPPPVTHPPLYPPPQPAAAAPFAPHHPPHTAPPFAAPPPQYPSSLPFPHASAPVSHVSYAGYGRVHHPVQGQVDAARHPEGNGVLPHSHPPAVNPQMHNVFAAPPVDPFAHRYNAPHHLHPAHPPLDPYAPDFSTTANRNDMPANGFHSDSYSNPNPNPSPPSASYNSDRRQLSLQPPSFRNHNRSFPFQHAPNGANQTHKPHVKGQKRFQDYQGGSSGRYWSYGDKPGFKRHKSEKGLPENKSRHFKSRFASLPSNDDEVAHRPPRPAPLPIAPNDLRTGLRPGNFQPTSRSATVLLRACVKVEDRSTIAKLYDRDFKPSPSETQSSPCSVRAANGDEEYEFEAVVGTSEEIEKDYLRLTSAPKPSAVRPPPVLKQALDHIKNCWREAEKDYDWVCRQLKSVRQDYKVQHIENTDVVDVYETHARIALENSDLGEFNTCVAQVQDLYHRVERTERVQDEFASYRILYNLLVGANEWEQGKILAQFSVAERNRKATRFALRIRQAVVSGNYHNYFRLSLNPPSKTMISYLLVHFHDRMRCRAITAMAAAYGPGYVPLPFVFDELGWRAENEPGDAPEVARNLKKSLRGNTANSSLLQMFSAVNIFSQPAWVLKALSFLTNVGTVLKVEDGLKPGIERLLLDCKSTKTAGIQLPQMSKKLITHAGSEL